MNRKTLKQQSTISTNAPKRVVRMDSVAQAARLDRELRDDQLNAVNGGFGSAISGIGKAISGIVKAI